MNEFSHRQDPSEMREVLVIVGSAEGIGPQNFEDMIC